MIDFARLGLLLAVLAFSVNANEQAKETVRSMHLKDQSPLVHRLGDFATKAIMNDCVYRDDDYPSDLDCCLPEISYLSNQ